MSDTHETKGEHEHGGDATESRSSRRRAVWKSARHALLVFSAYALLCAAFFAPVIFNGRLLAPGDGARQYAPNFFAPRVWWETLTRGGSPAFADPQVMMWYAPRLVCQLLPGGWNLFMLSAYVLAASFTYGYVFRLTRSRLAAAASGATFALCGFMIVHAVHATIVHSAAWVPLFVWSLEELRRGGGARRARLWFVVGAVSVALCALAGHPQIFAYAVCLGVAAAVFNSGRAACGRVRYLAVVAALVALGAGLAALQLVPTAELARLSVRSELSFDTFTMYQLPLGQLPTLLFPLIYGGAPKTFYALPYFGAWGSEDAGWNASEVTGYVGVLPLLLAALALFARRRRGLAIFWCGVAVVALLLALGSATPLGVLTYHLPFINKFRVPGRHLLELSFAVSVLAGLGVAAVARRGVTARQIERAVVALCALALLSLAALALFRADFDAQARAVAGHAVSLAPWENAAACVPLCVLLASALSCLWWSRRPASRARRAVLMIVLVCDLASLGWFSEWHKESPAAATLLAPPPSAVRLRDALAATSQRALPVRGSVGTFDETPPELSRVWRVPSAGGYGPLMLARTSRLLSMLPHGEVTGAWAEARDSTLDVFAVRYVTVPRETKGARADDAPGAESDLNLNFGKSCGANTESLRYAPPAPVRATHLRAVSLLHCSAGVADNSPVLSITLTDTSGRRTDLRLLAGRDSSEWAYDCPDVRAGVRHSRARVSGSFPTERAGGSSCEGHDYASELETGSPVEIKTIEMRWAGGGDAALVLKRLTLEDRERGASYHLSPVTLLLNDEARWRLFAVEPSALVYENLRARPRAWLAAEVVNVTADEALAAIKTSRLPDGRAFDPARTALVEEPQSFLTATVGASARGVGTAVGEARVVEESGASITVETDAPTSAFLVLSDANYPGWRASVDGREAQVFQTDYALRGVAVPAGRHAVRFEFRPRSFRVGLAVSLLSLAALAVFVSPFNPLLNAKPRSARRAARRRLGSRLARNVAALFAGDYLQKSRRERVLLSAVVFLYPLVYLCNQIVRVDGRYTGVDNDFGYCYYDYKVYLLDNLSRLRFLLWSPAEGAGYPFYSSPFPGALYPFNLLLVVFYRLAGGYAQYDHQVFTILGISVFALGLFHWLRLFPFSLRAVLFAALVMSASFKVTETVRFANSVQVAAWYPWILFAVTQIFGSRTKRRAMRYGALLFAFLVCHFTGGFPYFVYYSLFLVPVYLLVFLVPALRRRLWRQPVGDVRASLAVILASGFAALLLCAPYLYQTSRLVGETFDRGGFDYATEHEFLPLHTLGSLLFPPASQPEGWYYFGLVGLLILLLYFFDARGGDDSLTGGGRDETNDAGDAAWYRDRRIKIFFVAWIALVSYVTYGRHSYLFALLFKVMPLFASLRAWGRLNIVLVPVLAWLLALAYTSFEDRIFGERHDETRRRALLTRRLLTLTACYAAALAAQLYLFRHRLYDFYWARLGDFAHVRGKEAQFILAGFVSFLALAAVLRLSRAGSLRSAFAPPLVLALLVLLTALDTRPVGSQMWTYPAVMTERRRLDVARQIRDSFGRPRTDAPGQLPVTGEFGVGVLRKWYFARYNNFLARTGGELEARRKLLGVADGQKIFLSRSLAHETVGAFLEDSARFRASARVVAYDGDALALDVEAPAAGFVSFIDNWDAGWRATVDGQPAPIELLFGTFKSVGVPAGAHRVAFEYRPKFFGWLAARD